MDKDSNIDLQQFSPKKASKWYLVRILVYTLFLILLGYLIVSQLDKMASQNPDSKEIEGVTIELNEQIKDSLNN